MVLGANENDCFNLNGPSKVIPSFTEVKLLGIAIDNNNNNNNNNKIINNKIIIIYI